MPEPPADALTLNRIDRSVARFLAHAETEPGEARHAIANAMQMCHWLEMRASDRSASHVALATEMRACLHLLQSCRPLSRERIQSIYYELVDEMREAFQ